MIKMKKANKYLIILGVGLLLALSIALSNDIFSQSELPVILQILADSFTLPAAVFLGMGGLVFVSNEGGFDALSYGITSFADMFRKEKKNIYKSFYDYRESRADKKHGFGALLVCGIIFAVLTAIVLLIYAKLVY